MALILQTMFEHSDEEIDVVTVEDEESDGRLVNFDALVWETPCCEEESDSHIESDSDAEEAFVDVVNTTNAFPLEKADNADRVSSEQAILDVSTSFKDIHILRKEASTNTSLKRKRQDLDSDDTTAKVYPKRNKTNKQTNKSPNLLRYFTNNIRSFVWFHCPKCNAEKIFDSTDDQKNDLECTNCFIKMCKGHLINQAKLKCILVTCTNCNLKTEATDVYLDSVKCPKCTSDFALSCLNCSKQLTGLLETFYHANRKCKFDFYDCHHCDHKYIDLIDLQNHIRENHTSVVCPICRRIYKTRVSMLAHKRYCNKSASSSKCCFCYFSSKFKHSLKRHLINKHAEKFETSADLQAACEKMVENKSSRPRPISPSQNEIENSENSKVLAGYNHYCSKCKRIVDVSGKYDEKHCLTCNSITIYQCSKCGSRKKTYRLICIHLRCTCYPKEVLRCDHCSYTTMIKSTLISHINISHMYKEYYNHTRTSKLMYYCDRCEKTSNVSGPRKNKHCLVCKNIVLFQCNKCHHKFKSYSSFLYHVNDICHP